MCQKTHLHTVYTDTAASTCVQPHIILRFCSAGGVIVAGGLLPPRGHPYCDSRGSVPGPALCRVCEAGHGPHQHCCHDGGWGCLCWSCHCRSVSQTMHRLATELHSAQWPAQPQCLFFVNLVIIGLLYKAILMVASQSC